MTAEERGKFLLELMCIAPPLQVAVQITGLPDRRFDEVISVLAGSPSLMANIMSWMTPLGRQRVASVIPLAALGGVYLMLTEANRARMACPILFDWVKAAQKTSDERGKYGGVGRVWSRGEWDAEPGSARTGIVLNMTDEQLDQLQEVLK